MSDLSKDFERDDIFTRKDAISGLKSSPWAGLGKLVNTPLDSSIGSITGLLMTQIRFFTKKL